MCNKCDDFAGTIFGETTAATPEVSACMTKSKGKFYAVREGREGPKVYYNWPQCEKAVIRWPGARHKSFATKREAIAWINLDHNLGNVDVENPSLTTPGPRTSHQTTPLSDTPPMVTENFIPLPSSADDTNLVVSASNVTLSGEQEHILDLAKQGKNIFFTGSAGTGKSALLREIIDHFGGRISARLGITASTGIAAVKIGGVTLHSWAGIGLGIENVDVLIAKVKGNKYSRKRWRQTQTLIIDEISLVHGVLYDKLDCIARSIRESDLPFGGIQVCDFCQLPPVPDPHGTVCFAFESRSWGKCFETPDVGTVHRLTKVFRQSDETFINMLNSLRHGKPDARTSAQFQELSRPIHYDDGLEPCELFPLREQAREANETRLQRLPGELQTFLAWDIAGHDMHGGPVSIDKAKKLLERLIAPEMIELKVGAQVMLIKNLERGKLVNGSIGQVIAFLSLAEARGFHTEIAEVNESESERLKQKSHEQAALPDRVWPAVRFLNGRTLLLTPAEFEVVSVRGEMEARRHQVPLILSWAFSIHKSQGQTIERVKVDLSRVFEKGQAYVALSRATCLAGLQVLNFHPSIVMAHPRVLEYYECLDERLDGNQVPPPALPVPEPYDEFDEFDDEEAMASYYAADLEPPKEA